MAAVRRQGQEIETGAATAIEITKKQIAEIEEEIARIQREACHSRGARQDVCTPRIDVNVLAMSKAEDFISTLHVLAAGDAPVEQLHHTVWVVFTRFVQGAEAPLGNQSAVEASVVELQDALLAPTTGRR